MEFLSLLAVLVIICTERVTARPTDNDAKDSIENGLESASEIIRRKIVLPTSLQNIASVQINGSLNDHDKFFKLVIPSDAQDEKCQVVYDFARESLVVWNGSTDQDKAPETSYKLNFDSRKEVPFSFFIRPLEDEEGKMLIMHFDGNNNGVNTPLSCNINYYDVQNIIIEEGVQSITSLLINFMESY